MFSAEQARQTSVNSNKGVRDALFNIDQAIKKSCEQPVNNFYVEVSGILKTLSYMDTKTVENIICNNGYTITHVSSSEVLVKW